MNGDLRHSRLGRSAMVMTALVLAAGCVPSANPSGSPASAASLGTSPSTTVGASHSPGESKSAIDLTTLTGRIVFDNGEDVWSINADGTGLTHLTDSPWREFDPAWSPDGTRIAFRAEPNDEPELWLMNADGSDQHRLASGGFPAWSADGSRILYASPDFPSAIAIMNVDGSGQHRVPNTANGCEYPSWSPDEKRIAFNCNPTGNHVMYIVGVDGSGLVDLSSVGEGWQVAWSRDGNSILFASGRDQDQAGYDDIYVMRPDGSGVQRLTDIRGYTPAWSPDGSYIVFSAPGTRRDATGRFWHHVVAGRRSRGDVLSGLALSPPPPASARHGWR